MYQEIWLFNMCWDFVCLLQVNHSPSFNTDSELDREIKGALVWDSLNLVNFGACDRRRCIEEEKRRIKDRLLGRGVKKETRWVQLQAEISDEKCVQVQTGVAAGQDEICWNISCLSIYVLIFSFVIFWIQDDSILDLK